MLKVRGAVESDRTILAHSGATMDIVTGTLVLGGSALGMLAVWLSINGWARRWRAARQRIKRRLMASPGF